MSENFVLFPSMSRSRRMCELNVLAREDILFVTDSDKNVAEDREVARRRGRDRDGALHHHHGQSDGLERGRFAAGVGAGYD